MRIGAIPPRSNLQLDDALVQLVGAELVYRRGTPPDAVYTVKHALVQDAAYSTLLRSRRLQLHAEYRSSPRRQSRRPRMTRAGYHGGRPD